MKTKGGFYIFAAFALLTLAFFLGALQYKNLYAKLMPLVVSALGFALAITGMVMEFRKGEAPSVTPETEQAQKKSKDLLRRYFNEAMWLVGFSIAIYIFGFLITVPVFIVAYLKLHNRRWLISIVIAAVMTAVLYVLFTSLLGVHLYPGLILELLGW